MMDTRTAPSTRRTFLLVSLAMLAFAANSLLCRLALRGTGIDAASFTAIRLASGALVLTLIVAWPQRRLQPVRGSWSSAAALFAYAAAFSFAYLELSAATGALLLFGAVQTTMISVGLWSGERFQKAQLLGFLLAIGGLAGLLLPGVAAPPPGAAALMVLAGIAWGMYSLRGRGQGDPTQATAGNFVRTLPWVLLLLLLAPLPGMPDTRGILLAVASGALASGIGYALWYAALPALAATQAATLQLSVPVITAIGGVLFLGEALSLRLVLASIAILGGIALVVLKRAPR